MEMEMETENEKERERGEDRLVSAYDMTNITVPTAIIATLVHHHKA